MIRTLQRKFVVTAMTAITGLILILLGALNGVNLSAASGRLDHTLEMLGETGGDIRRLPPMQPRAPKEAPFGFPDMRPNDYDTLMASNYFVVRFDLQGEAILVDVSRTSLVTGEEAEALAESVYQDGPAKGEKERFRYLRKESPAGTAVVFLDTRGEFFSCVRVLLLSVGAGAASWGLMLACVILLSKRAIRPIAENIERQKQFVTNAGHELKTPLAIILSNAEAMELYTGENKWSRNIKEQAARLGGLVNSLLLLARMDEGASQKRPVDLSRLTVQALEEFSPLMEEKGIKAAETIPPSVFLQADEAQLRHLLSVLLDNGIKYGDQGGSLEIRLERERGQVLLQIQNTCAALPEVPPDKLFERFYRGNAAHTQKSGGYGIGLSLARAIAEANQGTISAEYVLPNMVRFTVRFREKKEE